MVEFNLGYGEQETQIQKHLAFHQLFSSDPSLQQMYGPQQKYKMLQAILEKSGIKNVADYLVDPQQIPPQQPDPAQQMQMQMAMKQLEIQERQTAVAEMRAQFDAEMAQMKLQLEQLKAQQDFALKSDKLDLQESQQQHKEAVNYEELEIAKRADDVRAIASPNG
jgi:hypothetical protein